MKWPQIVKSRVKSTPTQRLQTFYGFFRTLVIALTIYTRMMCILLLPIEDFFITELKAIHNTTKYSSYLRWSHGEK